MDVAMPMVIARAEDFGLTGHETREELDQNRVFFEKMEAVRLEAGKRMGMGDVSASVTPKFGLLALQSRRAYYLTLFHALGYTPDDGGDRQSMFIKLRLSNRHNR